MDELRTSYAGGKVLELRLAGPIDDNLMRRWNAVCQSATVWTVYLDGEQDHTAEISAILNTLPVQDIEIKSPPIEAVIRHLYASPDHVSPNHVSPDHR